MPINKRKDGWYWGSKGPFDSRDKAEEVAQAAYSSGYTKFMKFMEKDGGDGGGGAIGGFTSADVSTTTYGSTTPKKKRLRKEDVVFTSTEDADEAFDGDKKKIKEKSGIERVGAFLRDFSPEKSLDKAYGEPYTNIKSNRKKGIMTTGMGVSGVNMSTTPDHSHATTQKLEKSLVVELLNFARTELRKNHNAPSHYDDYSLNPHQRLRPADSLQEEGSQKRPNTPSTETSVPHAGIENPTVHNMGTAGSSDMSARSVSRPNDGDEKIGAQQIPKKQRGYIKSGATLEMPAQSGNNFQAMEKADTVGGGSPHVATIQQPRQAGIGEKIPKYIERKGDIPLNQDIQQNDFNRTVQEKRRRDKQDQESVVEPPLESGASVGAYIQTMEKGFSLLGGNEDALEQGGYYDKDKERELPEDDEDIIHTENKEVLANVEKSQRESVAAWVREFLVKGL